MPILVGSGISIQGGIVVGDLLAVYIPGTQIVTEDLISYIVLETDIENYIILEQ